MSLLGSVKTGVTAAGSLPTNALAIQPSQTYTQVTVSTTNANGLILPASQKSGTCFWIRNDAAAAADSIVNVYPPDGGQINSLAADAPFVVGRSGMCSFVATGNDNYLAFGNKGLVNRTLAATATLSIDDNGAVFTCTKVGLDQTITLPDPTQCTGMTLMFVSGAVGTGVTTISCGTVCGVTSGVGTVGDSYYTGNATNCLFVAASSLGASWKLISNGTKWVANGQGNASGCAFS